MDEVKVGVFLSDCGKQLSEILDFNALTVYVKKVSGVVLVGRSSEFWRGKGLQFIVDSIKDGKINRVVVAESLPKLSEVNIVQAVENAGLNPYLVEVVDLKDHCAWPHRETPNEATEKAKAMLLAAIERAKLLESIEKLEFPVLKSALIIGGGIAGMQAAVDLADLGFEVHLVERAPFLGGLAAQAGRFFPTDDCAICIQSPVSDVKTITHTSRKCVYRSGFSEIPNLNILTNSRVVKFENGDPGNYKVTIEKKPRYVNELKCVACDLCTAVCPVEVPDEYNAKLKTRKAIYMNVPNVHPPIYVIDESVCKFHDCAKCVEVCPTKAIDLDQKSERITLNVGSIIVATGFQEFDSSIIKEYHYGDYPDVITNLELARMIDGFGPTGGVIVRPSDRKPAKKIVFIQCVGSRDRRYNSYCSSICCMISLKHAMSIKSAYPDTDITICYIDIRTTGRQHEDYYERAREMGIKFVKGRPTEISRAPEEGRLIVDVEDALLRRFLELDADLVVLAPAMVPSEGTKELAQIVGLLDEDGFFKEYNAKLRPTETIVRGLYICGGATFPKDAPTTSLHAHSAALKAAKFMTTGKIIKDQRTAVINEEYCGDCEFCPVTCPYGAISLVPTTEEHFVAKVSDLMCEGCGVCVGTCPVNAIELRHSRPNQMLAQMKALISINGTSKPLVLAICCSECGHTAVDSSGMAMMQYPANIRVMKVPCTGILQVHQFLEAFKAGAQGVMVVGCKSDGCHYEVGSEKAEKKVELARILLKEYGIEPDRLELFNMVFIEGKQFAEAARTMTKRLETLGSLQLMGGS